MVILIRTMAWMREELESGGAEEDVQKNLVVLSWAVRQMVSTGGEQRLRELVGFIWELLRVENLGNIRIEILFLLLSQEDEF